MTKLHFNFNNRVQIFINPIEIIIANTINDVIPSFMKIQQAINDGYYVAGYISYEAAPAFNSQMNVHQNSKIPLLWFGVYQDIHDDEKSHSNDSYYITDWLPNVNVSHYNQAIHSIKNAISNGDSYQVNYTIRMNANFYGDAFAYFQTLANLQAANYSAFLDIGDYQILSASPELFFHLKDKKIITKPMKGTIGRGKNLEEDQQNAEWLLNSEKNRSENVMIVDLLRNDLGKIAIPGSVQVPELFSIEEYPTVYQMTSTITAEITEDKNILDIFKALFPCGSITGAPKISTMNLIHQLETSARDVYCGAIGYMSPNKEAIFNVPIRTVLIDNHGNATYGVGGGITWDSFDSEEYNEVLTKANILSKAKRDFELIETIGLHNGELLVFKNHLKRMQKSAAFFKFDYCPEELETNILNATQKHQKGNWKVRVLLNKQGSISIEVTPIVPFVTGKQIVSLSHLPVNRKDIFLYHKTTIRDAYSKRLKPFPDVFDVLLWNEENEITEFTRGNIVVDLEGELLTPPVTSGLLAGTYREALLDEGIIKERVITKEDIKHCRKIWFINSVREWIEVDLK